MSEAELRDLEHTNADDPRYAIDLGPIMPKKVKKTDPILVHHEVDEGPPQELVVPRNHSDNYSGTSLLCLSHKPQKQHPDIPVMKSKKKKKYKDVKYPTLFVPPEIDDEISMDGSEEEHLVENHEDELLPAEPPPKVSEPSFPPSRKSSRLNPTKAQTSTVRTIFKLTVACIGVVFFLNTSMQNQHMDW